MASSAGVPTTVQEVLGALDRVIARAVDEGSRAGYFAAIYRKVTAKVAEGIGSGFFDDAERMQRLDVTFANRYLAALSTYQAGGTPTKSWAMTFAATKASRPIILQHLLLGINAHINLDLGIAAADTAPGGALASLRRDFDRINEILASMLHDIAHDIDEVSPWIGLLDKVGGHHDDELVRFSIEMARTEAWRFASELAPLPRDSWSGPIGARDTNIARLADTILHPGLFEPRAPAHPHRESNDVARVIRVLNSVPGPDLAAVEAAVQQERATERPAP